MEKSKFLEILELDLFTGLQLTAIILLTIGIYWAFSSDAIAETGYGELLTNMAFLKSIGELSTIKLTSVVFTILSAVILYLSLTKASENRSAAFLMSLLFLLSPLVANNLVFFVSFANIFGIFLFVLALAIFVFADSKNADKNLRLCCLLPIALGVFLLYSEINTSIDALSLSVVPSQIGSLGFILPLSFLPFAFAELRKKEIIVPFVVSLILALLLPSLSLVMLSFYAVVGFAHLLKNKENIEPWLVLSFFIVFYLGIEVAPTNISCVFIGAAVAVFVYFLFSLQIISPKIAVGLFMLLIIALAYSTVFIKLDKLRLVVPSAELIALFKSTSNMNGTIAILEFPNAFKFYSNKEAKIVTQEQLMAKKKIDADYLATSADSLYRTFENRSSVMKFFGVGDSSKGIFVFGNKAYLLYVALSPAPYYNVVGEPAPILYDLKSGYRHDVPFSKLRSFSSSLPLTDSRNAIINLEPLTDTALYNMIVNCEKVQEGNGTNLFKVC